MKLRANKCGIQIVVNTKRLQRSYKYKEDIRNILILEGFGEEAISEIFKQLLLSSENYSDIG